ncbi:type IV toxin-antitoxin system AbiEi family antitoxin domain-containing protein [Rhodococcus qingshengii]|uniref:type IV toxin-antitoxin system AbiEi family antitoxin domain-containing protein n=1 Tax=Rhodococcus qingshengii TaxID=334542 RepID=UPI0007E594C2|nr:type IV toxin-antitoxin system AbiEi family antitoxin domain-containing protein [Rhodococcus qingshengii]
MTTSHGGSEFLRILDAQSGLVRQQQLSSFGYNRGMLRNFLDRGEWQRVLQGVYAVTAGPLTREMILNAAWLYGGAQAILSHDTAAEEWGMRRIDADKPVHVTVPYGKSARCQSATIRRVPARTSGALVRVGGVVHPGVVVHRSRAHRYIGVPSVIPRTSRADTAIDLATAESTARSAYVSLITTVTNARIPLNDVRRRIDERTPHRFKGALSDAVRLLADGVQSTREYHYAVDVEQAHGLPSARRQSPVRVDGRTLYEDCDYSEVSVPLIVRLDGRWAHSMAEVAFRDRRRDNAAELAGRPRLVYGFDEVMKTPCQVAHEVETVLRRGGWVRTQSGACGTCAPFW